MRSVFRRCLNVCSVLDSQIPIGNLFQTVGVAKLKACPVKFVVWGRIRITVCRAETAR